MGSVGMVGGSDLVKQKEQLGMLGRKIFHFLDENFRVLKENNGKLLVSMGAFGV